MGNGATASSGTGGSTGRLSTRRRRSSPRMSSPRRDGGSSADRWPPALIDEVRLSGVARVSVPPRGQAEELGFLISSECVDCGGFLRVDCDGNGVVGGNSTDGVLLLDFGSRGGRAPPCSAACDAEANGSIGITDALRILRYAFLGMADDPFPECTWGDRQSDIDLGCETPLDCQ